MDPVRTFVGCMLDAQVARALERTQDRLRIAAADAQWKVSWTRAEQFHFTLKFLGDVEVERLGPLAATLGESLRGRNAVPIQIASVGAFVDRGFPTVLYAEVQQGREALVELANAVDVALEPLGFPREKREFRAHVTLGRVRRAPRSSASEVLSRVSLHAPLGTTIRHVQLFRSDRGPEGSRYQALGEWPLSDVS